MIKLVVSDMDGTLLNEKTEISQENLKAIHKLEAQGIEFAIASGRDYQGVYSVIHDYGLHCEAILGNGAQYVDKNARILMDCYMNKNIIKDVISIFADAHIPYMVFTTDGFYTTQSPQYVRDSFVARGIHKFHRNKEDFDVGGKGADIPCNHLKKIADIDEFLARKIDIIKVEAFSLDPKIIVPHRKKLAVIPTISYLSSFNDNVEITDQNAQKGLILESVIALKGLKKEEVMVIGDGMNDITLFQRFPYSFAPMNAEKEIKSLAYQIVADCEADGFAEAIEFMLKELKS